MASYDLQTLTAVECVQFDGSNIADLQAICSEARLDPTQEHTVTVPIGGSHNYSATMHVGDWLTSVETGEFVVLPNTTFEALFTATP